MSDRKLAQKLQPLLKQVWKLSRRLTKAMVNWLLRTVFLLNRRPRVAGFVLPTTVFLILVVSLTVGALTFRSFNSTTRTIGNVQSRQIYNAATPAIDRARSKLDYLFGKDNRLPSGIPAEEVIISMLLNDGRSVGTGAGAVSKLPAVPNPYTFVNDTADTSPETRIDINGDNLLDNAWVYRDKNTNSSVIYSITLSTPDLVAGKFGPLDLLGMPDTTKAQGDQAGPYARNGPLSNSEAVSCRAAGGGSTVEGGWYQDQTNTSILRKRFQVDAFVVSNDTVNKGRPTNFTTLEFAQDRKLDRGNKWGAWFKYDLEVTPGAKLNWNGAMHSEGSILIGRNVSSTSGFSGYLISSQNSCLFRPASNSEISARQFDEQKEPDKTLAGKFFGIIGAGDIRSNDFSGSSEIHTYDGSTYKVPGNFTSANDWNTGGKGTLSAIATDPKALLTRDIQQAIAPDITNEPDRLSEANIDNNVFAQEERFFVTKTNTQPYVDDTYRADNRYGPKVRYKNEVIPSGTLVGTDIPVGNDALVNDVATASKEVGLDGYWERRTFKDSDLSGSKVYTGGMRILVGERLELGNPYGWVAPQNRPDPKPAIGYLANTTAYPVGTGGETGDVSQLRKNDYTATTTITDVNSRQSDVEGDPLYPPYKYPDTNRAHEAKQRRALRDNLGAVQAAAVYHYQIGDGRTPAACLALTAHPGSPYTLRQSVNFSSSKVTGSAAPLVDFFNGKGTNGWEFIPPTVAQLASGGALNKALANLANFAGDPDGAFPPRQEAGKIHPDPILTMWGNFSNLRRALTGNGSPADESYLQTAGCTMGMLAYNIDRIQNFDPTSAVNQAKLNTLGRLLFPMLNGNVDDTQGEVLSKASLATYDYNPSGTYDGTKYNARDYDRVTPEMVLVALRSHLVSIGIAEPEEDARYQLATLIHEHFQIRRDRTYGFRSSPAVNTWNYNPYALQMGFNNPVTGTSTFKVTLWSSACDPNSFRVGATVPATATGAGGTSTLSLASAGVEAQRRLALSRLCGSIIPPGAVHDDAPADTAAYIRGDNNYPARKGTSLYVPTLEAGDDSQRPVLGQRPDTTNPDFDSTNPATLALLNNAANSTEELKRAQVLPKFPSLYYIFPEVSHNYIGAVIAAPASLDHRQPGNTALDSLAVAFQPWKEPYVTTAQSYPAATFDPISTTAGVGDSAANPGYDVAIAAGSLTGSGMSAFRYRALPAFQIADTTVSAAAIQPRDAIADWVLPTNATTDNPNRVIAPNGTVAVVPFQDKVAFNGREWLPSRVLDVDLDMLRTSDKGVGNDTWLPASGIVYAFREDAVREDGIARPVNALGYTNAQTPNVGGVITETDPPKEKFGVSVKAVDFIADPDRRPHGFRLRNGDVLKRGGSVPAADNFRGMSFITDQPAYIMGNFNRHQETPGGARLEEFKEQLPDDPTLYSTATFYDNRKTRETKFADPAQDLWRPSEVLADSVIVLSDKFCDGSAIDTFMTAGSNSPGSRLGIDNTNTFSGAANTKAVYTNGTQLGGKVYDDQTKALFAPGCENDATNGATSFLNQNRPAQDLTGTWNWARENPSDPINSPVKISRNGNGLIVNNSGVPIEYSSANDTDVRGRYFDVVDTNNRARALQDRGTDATTVNAILISNIIPSRANQQNGALNNFLRFLEDWRDSQAKVRFAGSFLQLGFSNYATAPFDQDRWEPTGGTITSAGTEYVSFFRPPARLWGYDVALQLAQASPAATRFTSPSSEKNEFYTEPAANDPYMQNLCNALRTNPPTGLDATKLNCPT
ncbi:MAG: hypothetical protein DCF22_06760 [Leptolyngbya sp.]|nr:MAG: hypothetical protein DCF22_06760 [Leptolyngbya sp.]